MTTTETTTAPAPGTRIVRTTTATGTSDLTVPSWAADLKAAEMAAEPGVVKVEVIGTDGRTVATYPALVPLPGVTPMAEAERAFLDDLIHQPLKFCGVCPNPHGPVITPCPSLEACPDCYQIRCTPDCPNRYEPVDGPYESTGGEWD